MGKKSNLQKLKAGVQEAKRIFKAKKKKNKKYKWSSAMKQAFK